MNKSEQERADWFFSTFGDRIEPLFADTNITPDLVGAIALQETGYLWNSFWNAGADTEEEFLEFCVGDTVSNRSYFPKNHFELLQAPRGKEAFTSLRSALEKTATARKRLKAYAADPHNVLYGYGIFQYDLMFYEGRNDYDFFIEKRWRNFAECLKRLKEIMLQNMRRRGFSSSKDLDQNGKIMVALLYHRGVVKRRPLFKQGYCENNGRGPCYGEKIDRYLRMSRLAMNRMNGSVTGTSIMTVNARSGLNLRTGPGIEYPISMTAQYGDNVYVLARENQSEWVQVDLEGDGIVDGYMHSGFIA